MEAWEKFVSGRWVYDINVRDFIQKNYTPYDGDSPFLCGPSEKTIKLRNDPKIEIKNAMKFFS